VAGQPVALYGEQVEALDAKVVGALVTVLVWMLVADALLEATVVVTLAGPLGQAVH